MPARVWPDVVSISPASHYECYHDWCKALTFCRALPDLAPARPVTFHMLWRERRRGLFRRVRTFGRKQALPVKAFLATQDLSRCSLVLWSDEDLSSNEWLRPLAPFLTLRRYDPEAEVRGTGLEHSPALYHQRDHKVWRDGDLFRVLALHNYGGVYVDMDMVLLRSLGALLDQEFVYQWQHFDHLYNGALMHLCQGSEFARELIAGVLEIPPGEFNWGRENLRRAIEHGRSITVFPCAFFDTDWQADSAFQPFRKTPNSGSLHEGAFAWHWHNRWDERIEDGSKFQRVEARIDEKLIEMGLPAGSAAAVAGS